MLRHHLADVSIIDIAVSQLNFQVRCLVQQFHQRSALGENGALKVNRRASCSQLVKCLIKTALIFNSALSLERFASNLRGRHHFIKNSLLDINRECLQGFVALVKQHFDILHQDVHGSDEIMQFGASDLLSVIRTQSATRMGF